MRTSTTYYDLSVAKTLDPAANTTFSEATDIRAEARLHQILATDRTAPITTNYRGPQPARAWRWAAIPVAAAAAVRLGIVLPGAPGIAPAQANLLNWEAYSTPLTDEELSAADGVCRRAINDFTAERNSDIVNWYVPPGETPPRSVALVEQPAVAERRGEWGVIGYPQDGDLAICQVWFPPGGPKVALFQSIAGTTAYSAVVSPGSDGIAVRAGGYSFRDVAELAAQPASDDIDVRNTVETSLPPGANQSMADGGFFTVVGGRTGSDVTGVTLHTLTGGDVEASVANGWWVAWWPGSMGGPETYHVVKSDGIAGWNMDGSPIPDDGDPVRIWTSPGTAVIEGYTVTLADGSTEIIEASWADECSADDAPACFYDRAEAEAQLEVFRGELAADESAD